MSQANERLNGIPWYNEGPWEREVNAMISQMSDIEGGITYYVDASNGSDNNDGLGWDTALDTMAAAFLKLADRDRIVFRGDIDEHGLLTPAGIDFVEVIGVGNQPRSNRWRNTANAAEPHVTCRGSGWTFRNIYFAGGTADYCIELLRDATYNSSETRILGCIFNGGSGHIESNGGVSNVIIAGNRFINGRGGTATTPGAIIGTSTAQAVPTNWVIEDNDFYNCENIIACSMSRSRVSWNELQATGHDGACTQALNLVFNAGQGDYNRVTHNALGVAAAVVYDNDATLKFQDGANSIWADNYANDAVDYGLPG